MATKTKVDVKLSTNIFKIFFETFKTYWGYFMTFVAATTFIWTIGVKSERNTIEKESVKSDIIEMKYTQSEQNKKVDEILEKIIAIESNQIQIINSQNSLRNSYVKFVANFDEMKTHGLSTKQFIEYMEGIQFSIPISDTAIHGDTLKTIEPIKKKKPMGAF